LVHTTAVPTVTITVEGSNPLSVIDTETDEALAVARAVMLALTASTISASPANTKVKLNAGAVCRGFLFTVFLPSALCPCKRARLDNPDDPVFDRWFQWLARGSSS
jgi:hypothetical protein